MTTVEVKTEIQRLLDEVPENALAGILDCVKQIKYQSDTKNADRIMAEDKELFKRLAE